MTGQSTRFYLNTPGYAPLLPVAFAPISSVMQTKATQVDPSATMSRYAAALNDFGMMASAMSSCWETALCLFESSDRDAGYCPILSYSPGTEVSIIVYVFA